MTKCRTCGEPQSTSTGTTTLGRLPVTLDGIRVRVCPNGHRVEGIPSQASATGMAVTAIVYKPWPLSPGEFRLLRSHLGLSGKDAAALLGVTAATVSRWESGQRSISGAADRALRLIVSMRRQLGLAVEDIANISTNNGEGSLEMSLKWDGLAWQRVVAVVAA